MLFFISYRFKTNIQRNFDIDFYFQSDQKSKSAAKLLQIIWICKSLYKKKWAEAHFLTV